MQWLSNQSCIIFVILLRSYFWNNVNAYTYYDADAQVRITVIDLAIRFTPLAAPIDNDNWTKDKFITSVRIFLDENLHALPISVISLRVALGSQRLDIIESTNNKNDIEPYDNGNGGIPESLVTSVISEIQVLVEYRFDEEREGTGASDVEGTIVGIFHDRSDELLGYLKLFDREHFNNVVTLSLESNLPPADSGSILGGGSSTSPNTSSISLPLSTILICAIFGIGVLVALATAAPLFCRKRPSNNNNNNRRRRHMDLHTRTITTSGTPEGEVTQSSCDVGLPASFSSDMRSSVVERGKRRKVQRVYSSDKVTTSSTLNGLKLLKAHSAEEKLQRTLCDIRQTVFRAPVQQVVVEFRDPTDSKGGRIQGNLGPQNYVSADSTTSTGNPSDNETPSRCSTKSSQQMEEDSINKERAEKCQIPQPNRSLLPQGRQDRMISVDQIYFAQDCSNSTKSGLSVSTISGGQCSSIDDDDEDEDEESETFRYGRIQKAVSTPSSVVSVGMIRGVDCDGSVVSTDDFGSMAASVPPVTDESVDGLPTRIII